MTFLFSIRFCATYVKFKFFFKIFFSVLSVALELIVIMLETIGLLHYVNHSKKKTEVIIKYKETT